MAKIVFYEAKNRMYFFRGKNENEKISAKMIE